MKHKIMIYSDCFTYSGSENVIENILLSAEIRQEYDVYFSYAKNIEYTNRFWQRMNNKIDKRNVLPQFIFSRGYHISIFRNKSNKLLVRYISLLFALIIKFLEFVLIAHIFNFFKILFILKCHKPSLFYVNNGGYPGAASAKIAVFAAKYYGKVKIVFNVNNMAVKPGFFEFSFIDRLVNKYVDLFITASFAAQNRLVDVRFFDRKKMVRVPNTINEMWYQSMNDPRMSSLVFTIGCVGLLTFRKGFHVLIDAIEILVKRGVELFEVLIIGEGEEREVLERKIKNKCLESYVKLKGFKPRPLEIINNVDLFVIPSISNEDFPYVVIEAMFLGKPILGTNVSGIPEQVLENKNGFIIEPNNSEELANSIEYFINNKTLLAPMGEQSKLIYREQFSYNKVMTMYLNIFNKLVYG